MLSKTCLTLHGFSCLIFCPCFYFFFKMGNNFFYSLHLLTWKCAQHVSRSSVSVSLTCRTQTRLRHVQMCSSVLTVLFWVGHILESLQHVQAKYWTHRHGGLLFCTDTDSYIFIGWLLFYYCSCVLYPTHDNGWLLFCVDHVLLSVGLLKAILLDNNLLSLFVFGVQLVGRLSQEELTAQLPSFLPALFEAFGNQSADVRKVNQTAVVVL